MCDVKCSIHKSEKQINNNRKGLHERNMPPLYYIYIEHIECLKKLYRDPNVDIIWHSGSGDCTLEKDDLEALKSIIEEVYAVGNGKNVEEKWKDYLKCKHSK